MAKEEAKKAKVKRPSAQKRDIQHEKRRVSNKMFKSTMRTTIRKFEENLDKGDHTVSKADLREVYSILDKGVKYGAIKLNKASRTKARLTAHLAAKA